jgi:protein phosphatase
MDGSVNRARYEFYLMALDAALSVNVSAVTSSMSNSRLTLPRFPPECVAEICDDAKRIFTDEPTLLELSSPLVVVGDIHGQLLDLVRIFQETGRPPITRYLFLGDVVDRGEFSLECVLTLFVLKVLHRSHVLLIRGNHEFESSAREFGFQAELCRVYPNVDLLSVFCDVFAYLPLAATIDRQTFCIHGGIGPTLVSLSQIRSIERPIYSLESELLRGMLWSDPSEDVNEFSDSTRGTGFQFGRSPLFRFLRETGLLRIIRAHECVQTGISKIFDKRCITVFSASNYCGRRNNYSAVLRVNSETGDDALVFPPIDFIPRACTAFKEFPLPDNITPMPGRGRTGLPKKTPNKIDFQQGKQMVVTPRFETVAMVRSRTSLTPGAPSLRRLSLDHSGKAQAKSPLLHQRRKTMSDYKFPDERSCLPRPAEMGQNEGRAAANE